MNLITSTRNSGLTPSPYPAVRRQPSPFSQDDYAGLRGHSISSGVTVSGVMQGTSGIVYACSGLGDRLRQNAEGVTMDYTLDINAGLTQVLQDGKQTYVYGNQRISQIAETQTGYFRPMSWVPCAR